jgi:hypothetical protein
MRAEKNGHTVAPSSACTRSQKGQALSRIAYRIILYQKTSKEIERLHQQLLLFELSLSFASCTAAFKVLVGDELLNAKEWFTRNAFCFVFHAKRSPERD